MQDELFALSEISHPNNLKGDNDMKIKDIMECIGLTIEEVRDLIKTKEFRPWIIPALLRAYIYGYRMRGE